MSFSSLERIVPRPLHGSHAPCPQTPIKNRRPITGQRLVFDPKFNMPLTNSFPLLSRKDPFGRLWQQMKRSVIMKIFNVSIFITKKIILRFFLLLFLLCHKYHLSILLSAATLLPKAASELAPLWGLKQPRMGFSGGAGVRGKYRPSSCRARQSSQLNDRADRSPPAQSPQDPRFWRQ